MIHFSFSRCSACDTELLIPAVCCLKSLSQSSVLIHVIWHYPIMLFNESAFKLLHFLFVLGFITCFCFIANRNNIVYVVIFQGRLVDSYDKLGQDLNNELNWLSDVEQLLRDDHPISDDLDKVKGHLQAQKVLVKSEFKF